MSLLGYKSKEYTDERGREYFFDNAKFILIILVVLAHAISPLKTDMKKVSALWVVINTLHMPCMILISGYFAKSYIKNGVVKTQRLVTYIVYYLAAQFAVSAFEYFVLNDKKINKSVFFPRSSLWYLFCLCVWFLILPYVSRLKPKYLLSCAFIFALYFGFDSMSGDNFSISRVVNHFPIFLIGYYFKKEWFFKFRNLYTQIAAVIVFMLSGVIVFFNLNKISNNIITSNTAYEKAGLKFLNSGFAMCLHRVIFYICALILCAAFLMLVPRGKAFFTKLGSRTLQVYILHRFLYLAELKYLWWKPFNSAKGTLLMAAIAVAVTFILSLKPFEYPFKALAKIKLDRFERDELHEKKGA